MLAPNVRGVLDGDPIAHLATILPDGSPHTTPVFVGTLGDQVVIFTGPGMRKGSGVCAPVGAEVRISRDLKFVGPK